MHRAILRIAATTFTVLAGLALLAPAAGADQTISVDDNFFKPKNVKVTVPEKVTWKWDGFVAHNVVVKKGPQKFKSKIQSEGTFSRVIKKPGVYRIVCTLHPGMTMKITAEEATPATTAPSTVPAT
jgi:plastocyanin